MTVKTVAPGLTVSNQNEVKSGNSSGVSVKGIDRQTTSGKSILIGTVYRAEIARAEEGDDIAARQLRRFKRAEPGKAEVGLPYQLFGVYAGVVVVKQFRAEVNLPRLLGL